MQTFRKDSGNRPNQSATRAFVVAASLGLSALGIGAGCDSQTTKLRTVATRIDADEGVRNSSGKMVVDELYRKASNRNSLTLINEIMSLVRMAFDTNYTSEVKEYAGNKVLDILQSTNDACKAPDGWGMTNLTRLALNRAPVNTMGLSMAGDVTTSVQKKAGLLCVQIAEPGELAKLVTSGQLHPEAEKAGKERLAQIAKQ